jgi:hypothetical protein
MAKAWEPRLIALPNGQAVRVGANGHLSVSVPCGHCSKAIRYYKGDMTKWPWYCSPACESREPFKDRCQCCYGAMRRPIRLAKDRYVCKSCSLRLAHLFRKMGSMDAKFLKYFVNRFVNDIVEGVLEVSFVQVTNGIWEYVRKTPPEARVPKVPKPRRGDSQVYEPDADLEAAINGNRVNPDGTFKADHPDAGKHYRTVFPDPRFLPPPSDSV